METQAIKYKKLENDLDKTIELFQEVMLNLVQRRAIISHFYDRLRSGSSEALHTSFFIFYTTDYLRSQLMDCRSFFEKKSQSHQLSKLNELFNNTLANSLYEDLEKLWEAVKQSTSFHEIVDKSIAHKEKGYQQSQNVMLSDLHELIDVAEKYLHELTQQLTRECYDFKGLVFSSDSSYVKSMSEDVDKFIAMVSSLKK